MANGNPGRTATTDGASSSNAPAAGEIEMHGTDRLNTAAGGRQPAESSAARSCNQARPVLIQRARSALHCVDGDTHQRQLLKPRVVPIGPYHRDSFSTSTRIEEEKERALERVLPRESERRDLVEIALPQLVMDAKKCYDPDDAIISKMMQNDSLWSTMLLRDGCYVLSLLKDFKEVIKEKGEGKDHHQAVVKAADIAPPTYGTDENTVLRDILFLLENQIPWLVLNRMFRCIVGDPKRDLVAGRVLGVLKRGFYVSREKSQRQQPTPPSTLLDLVYYYMKPLEEVTQYRMEIQSASRPTGRWRGATEYRRHGFVRLKPQRFKKGVAESVLDVRLEGRTLRIPTLRIEEHTWTILRNLMALEDQMIQSQQRPVTAYCLFMSQLADKVEDVELLQRQGILQVLVADAHDVVRGFATLCAKVVFDVDRPEVNYLHGTWHKLQKRCKSKWYNTLGFFVDVHCGNPMLVLALVFAVLAFILQGAQVGIAAASLYEQLKSRNASSI